MSLTRTFNKEEILEACKKMAESEGYTVKGKPTVEIRVEQPDRPGLDAGYESVEVEMTVERIGSQDHTEQMGS